MNKDKIVEIFNNSTSSVSIIADRATLRFAAPSYKNPTIIKKVKFEDLLDIYNTPGVEQMFATEILLIKENDVREYLGLEPLTKYTKGLDEILSFLEESSISEFEEFLMYCSNMVLENVVDIASKSPAKDMNKNTLIRRYSGQDPYEIYRERDEEKTQETTKGRLPVDGSAPTIVEKPEVKVLRRGVVSD